MAPLLALFLVALVGLPVGELDGGGDTDRLFGGRQVESGKESPELPMAPSCTVLPLRGWHLV